MKKRLSSRIKISLLLVGILSLGYWGWDSKSSQSATALQTTTVSKGELIQRSTISGVVTPLRKTIVTAPYQGFYKKASP